MNEIMTVAGEVARIRGVTLPELLSQRRSREIVRPRQEAMYFARLLTPASLPAIGRRIGERDHTTVLHAIRITSERMKAAPAYAGELSAMERKIRAKLPARDEVGGVLDELDPLAARLLVAQEQLAAAERRAIAAEAKALHATSRLACLPAILPPRSTSLKRSARTAVDAFEALEGAMFGRGERPAREALARAIHTLRNELDQKEQTQ